MTSASTSPTRPGNTPAEIKSQGVYEQIASWRRQQTLTKKQIDPCLNSSDRRCLYKTGETSHSH